MTIKMNKQLSKENDQQSLNVLQPSNDDVKTFSQKRVEG